MSIERKGPGDDRPKNPTMSDALRKAGLTDGDKKPQPEPAKAQAQPEAPRQQQNQSQTPRGNNTMQTPNDYSNARRNDNTTQAYNLGDADRLHRRPVSRYAGSQRLRSVHDALHKELTASLREGETSQFRLVQLDQSQTKLNMSAVLLIQAATAGGQGHAAVFTFLLESPEVRLAPRVEKIDGGRSVEIPTVPGDVYNSKEFWNRVQVNLGELLPKGTSIHDAGAIPIPATLNLTEESANVHELIYRATVATWTVMNTWVQLEDEPAYTIVGRNRAEQLTARLNTSGETLFNAINQPIRSDISLELDSSTPGNGQAEAYLIPNQMLTKVTGFLQPVYAQPVENLNPNAPIESQPYWAQFVITNIESGYESYDLEQILLAICTSTLLSNNYTWADAFRPRYIRKGQSEDLRDIGAIGYAIVTPGTPPAKIDTKTEAFMPEFGKLIRSTFRNGLLYCIDVPEIGENAWAFDTFRAAANGDAQAYKQIVDAADNLTGGAFTQVFQGGGIAADDNNRIHLGQYVRREDGQLRDIRDIDYLAVLNLFGKTAPKTAVDFADTYSPKTGPLAQRLATRLQIISEALSDDFVLTGYANRLALYGNFVEALNIACGRAGLVVQPGNISTGLGGGQILGGYDVGAYAVKGNVPEVFSTGRSGYDQGANYQGRGRFGSN